MSEQPRTYRYGDASRPGLLLGLGPRQAIPVVAGVLWLAVALQASLPPAVAIVGPLAGLTIAFGRWRGSALSETLVPGVVLFVRRRTGRARWVQPPLLGDPDAVLPTSMRGLELIDTTDRAEGGTGQAVVRDREAGSVTGVLRVSGRGFPLASSTEQDTMIARWGSALTPFARERSPVVRVVWQEWAHPVRSDRHRQFLTSIGIEDRRGDPAVDDYLALLEQQAPVSIAHDVLVAVTIDQCKVRRRGTTSRLDAAIDVLADELRLFQARLDGAGLTVSAPLSPVELSSAVRIRSDPTRGAQVAGLTRSLAAASRRGAIEWGPMVVEPEWGQVRVDGAIHRSYRVAVWPQLPVGSDWLAPLLTGSGATRTVTVVMEPIPMSRAARAADREVMAREADADMKERKGFRVNARERKRLADVEARERELSDGHAEFRFVGLVTVTATDVDALDDECAEIEQAAGQSLLDLRPLDARHDKGWIASLPLGRNLAPPGAP